MAEFAVDTVDGLEPDEVIILHIASGPAILFKDDVAQRATGVAN